MTTARSDSVRSFALVVGLLAGMFVATVAAPKRQPTEIVAGSADQVATGAAAVEGADVGQPGAEPGGPTPAGGATADEGGVSGPTAAGPAPAATSGSAGSSPGVGAGTAPAPTGGEPGAAPARGVTGDAITIGVAYPDLGALRALGPKFDNGDVEKQWRALLAGWKRDGLLPLHGRDVRLVFRSYPVLSPEAQRAACIGLVQDEGAFAVVGQTFFVVGSECVARELRTPLLTSDGPSDAVFARSHPFLFSLQMSEDRLLRNLVHWADARGLLDRQKVGLYYENRPEVRDLVNKTLKAELARLGHELAAEASTDQALGGPQDAVAVQRFRSAGVGVALLLTSKAGFMQQAEAQGYKPRYLESDYLFGTSDTSTSTYPPKQFDGSMAMTGRRVGETRVGMGLGPAGDACVANYQRFSGEQLEVESAEWAYVLTGCDLGRALLTAVDAAGRGLSHSRFVAGLETMRNVPMTRYAPVTFTPDKHHGVDTQRTLRWEAGCACWKAVGRFEGLFVR